MLTQRTTLKALSEEKTLRYDVDYIKFHQSHTDNYYSFDDLFSILDAEEVPENVLNQDFMYCEIGNSDKNGDIFPVMLNFENRSLVDENYYSKIEGGDISSVQEGDILLSKVRPNLKKYIRITSDKKDVFFTTAFIRLKAKEMPDILYYCLRSIFYKDLMAIARQGKGYPTINEKDLFSLRFDRDIINKLHKNKIELSNKIKKVEEKVAQLSTTNLPSQTIIDSVFQKEFSLDYDRFNQLKAIKQYTSSQYDFANNDDLRFSAKFHRPAADFVLNELNRIAKKKVKDYIAEPIILGASISPKDYDESGDVYYVSMATIKTWAFDKESAQTVSKEYSSDKDSKYVQKNDIIMARSGEGTIGRVAIILDEEIKGIFADFTMRIRLDEKKYNPIFAYYYFRSCYFQYLIEVYKKGLGNNTNIFPDAIQEFPMPDISLDDQNRIATEIECAINAQTDIKDRIIELRREVEANIASTVIQ